jgi:hypothetical protein
MESEDELMATEERVPDIPLTQVQKHVIQNGRLSELVEAAATVANAIQIGAGAMIVGSLMEADLRKALGLKKGELVNVRHVDVPQTQSTKGE